MKPNPEVSMSAESVELVEILKTSWVEAGSPRDSKELADLLAATLEPIVPGHVPPTETLSRRFSRGSSMKTACCETTENYSKKRYASSGPADATVRTESVERGSKTV